MMKNLKIWSAILLSGSMLTMMSCGDDDSGTDGPAALSLSTLTASGNSLSTGADTTVDLNGATAGADVPPNSVITATFDRDLNSTTVSTTTVTLVAGAEPITVDVTVSGSTVTITPAADMPRGTDHTLTFTGIAASDGGALAVTARTFRTDGRADITPPGADSQHAYWRFDGNAEDDMGTYDPGVEVAIEYQADRFGAQNSCAYFDGDASIIEVAGAAKSMDDATDFTLSFWVKTNSDGHVNADGNPAGHFVFGLGAFFGIQCEIFDNYQGSKFGVSYENDTMSYSEDMWFPSNATDNSNGGWQGWDFARSLDETAMESMLKDEWLHAIFTYNATTKVTTLYYNGVKMKSFDFNLWPDGDPKQGTIGVDYRGVAPEVVDEMAFGFVQSRAGTLWDSEPWGGYDNAGANHFKGWLDDFRIIHAAYSDADASALYNGEKP